VVADEAVHRESICRVARELWLRGFLAGAGGMLTAECHRRRYLATPPGRRRAALDPAELLYVDAGGVVFQTEQPLDEALWQPHRLAYQATLASPSNLRDAPLTIAATVLCQPPCVLAWHALHHGENPLAFAGGISLAVVSMDDQSRFNEALRSDHAVLIPQLGLLTAGSTLDAAANLAEQLEQQAALDLATRRMQTA